MRTSCSPSPPPAPLGRGRRRRRLISWSGNRPPSRNLGSDYDSSFGEGVVVSPGEKLWAGNNCLHQIAEAVPIGGEFGTHVIDDRVVREQQASSQRIN